MSAFKVIFSFITYLHRRQWLLATHIRCLFNAIFPIISDFYVKWLHNFDYQFFFTITTLENNFYYSFQNALRLAAFANTRQFSRTAIKSKDNVPEGYRKIKLIQASFQVR